MIKPRIFLDLGNTRYKWIGEKLIGKGAPKIKHYAKTNEVFDVVTSVEPDKATERLVIASVKGSEFNDNFARWLIQKGIGFEFLSIPESPLIEPAYTDWSQFGIDRYLNLVAARREYVLPMIIVSAGTAVTFDLLDSDGRHAGGCIFPGLWLLKNSLAAGAAQIGEIATQGSVLARSTAEGVAGGVSLGFSAAIESIINSMKKKTTGKVTVLLTGGDAQWLNESISLPTRVDSLLLFKGMDKVSQNPA